MTYDPSTISLLILTFIIRSDCWLINSSKSNRVRPATRISNGSDDTKTHSTHQRVQHVTKSNTIKKLLPASELINRRKSPALWRFDLSNDEPTHQHPKKPFFPQARPPEVMAPVGGFPQLYAAIANGADSVYLGLSSFSARARATNFSPDQLAQAVSIAHASSVKVYVAFNTLIFDYELEQVEELLSHCIHVGVDAVIAQDAGVAEAVAKWNRRNVFVVGGRILPIHASTQQTITSTDGVVFAKNYGGATRVVLGRELSVKEIEQIVQELHERRREDDNDNSMEVEVFVHRALCVSYSGQCFPVSRLGDDRQIVDNVHKPVDSHMV